jgi:GDP-L-fucose synthase
MDGIINRNSRIYVAGHRGLVGSAITRRLRALNYCNIITATREQLDLRDQAAVNCWFRTNRPDYVFLVAGTVGGIYANMKMPAEFIYDNMMIHATVVHASYLCNVKKLLYLGSSCIYPRDCPQPMKEEYLLTGPLEPTNEAYAIAKIAGIKLCAYYRKQYGCNYISAMPTNLYGINDNYDIMFSHVMPALIRKFHEAKINNSGEVQMWGTGKSRREFLHVDDLAAACMLLMEEYESDMHINVGTGVDVQLCELANIIRNIIAPEISIKYDSSKPDGMPRKMLDITKMLSLGWKPNIGLEEGIRSTYKWFKENYNRITNQRIR